MNQLRNWVALFITIFLLFILSGCNWSGEPVAPTGTGEELPVLQHNGFKKTRRVTLRKNRPARERRR